MKLLLLSCFLLVAAVSAEERGFAATWLSTFYRVVYGDPRCMGEFKSGPDGSCYRLFQDRQTFREAEETCEAHGAQLAELTDQDIYNFIQTELHKLPTIPRMRDWDDAFYVGAKDSAREGDFHWLNSRKQLPRNSDWWGPNEPNNGREHPTIQSEDCVNVYYGGLNDFDCTKKLRFICQRKPHYDCKYPLVKGPDHRCYNISQERGTYPEAERRCQVHGGSLAVMSEDRVYDFIQRKLSSLRPVPRQEDRNEAYYVGAKKDRRSSVFKWLDETLIPSTSSRWGPNEPTNQRNQEECVSTYYGGINDVNCRDRLHFICQYPGEEAATDERPLTIG